MSGTKVPKKYDDIIDSQCIKLYDFINPYFKALGFTPNGITTLSFAFGLLTCYFYYTNQYVLSSVCFLISFLFDGMDGYFARVYKMSSKFGAMYDSFTDTFVGITLVYLFCTNKKLSFSKKRILLFLLCFATFITMYHLNCQNKYAKKYNENYVGIDMPIKCNHFSDMKYTRYFGTGFLYCFTSFIIFLHTLI